MESLKNGNQHILNKLLIMLVIVIGMFFVKSNPVFADASAYYLGSKDATKATGYNVAKNSDGSNIETSLDLTQTLDKIIYYILTYEEYDNKTYIGDSSNLNVEERKQAALYYFIHNYKQEENRYSALTTNERLKNILANYAGNGNNLSEFESYNRNGAQVIYALAESWAKGEDMLQAASKLKVNYIALANDNVKYWASITEYPLEDSIYNPTTEENTLIISVYFPQEIEKTAQNAIKVVEKEILEEKKETIRSGINRIQMNLLGAATGSWPGGSDLSYINSQDYYCEISHGFIASPRGYVYVDTLDYPSASSAEERMNTEGIINGTYINGTWYTHAFYDGFTAQQRIMIEQYIFYSGNSLKLGHSSQYSRGTNKQKAYWAYLDYGDLPADNMTIIENWYNSQNNENCSLSVNDSSSLTISASDVSGYSYKIGPFTLNRQNTSEGKISSIKLGTTNISKIKIGSTSYDVSDLDVSNLFNGNGATSKEIYLYINSTITGSQNLQISYSYTQTKYQFEQWNWKGWNGSEGGYTAWYNGHASGSTTDGTKPYAQAFMKPIESSENKEDSCSKSFALGITPKVIVKKVDKNTDSVISTSAATFQIGGTTKTTSSGYTEEVSLENINYGTGSSTTIQETIAPTGYVRDNTSVVTLNYSVNASGTLSANISGSNTTGYSVESVSGNVITVKVTDTAYITPKIQVVKKDKDTPTILLDGAGFTIGSDPHTTGEFGASQGYTTQKSLGDICYGGSGNIKIKETSSPTGYQLNNPNEVTVNYSVDTSGTLKVDSLGGTNTSGYSYSVDNTNKIITIEVKDSHMKYNLIIKKVNKQNPSQGIPNAVFTVSDGNTLSNATKTTGNDGSVSSNNLLINSNSFTISIRETSAPANVTIDYTQAISITVTANQSTGGISHTYTDSTGGIYAVSRIGNTITVIVYDTVQITPKLKIIKVDSNDHNTKLKDAKFHVKIPNADNDYITNGSGETSTINLKNIVYGSPLDGTIQEIVAPVGYRVDNKDAVSIRITYKTSGSGSFSENRVHVSLSGNTKGYSIRNLVSGTDYINGDTIEILVTDTPIQMNLKIVKKDFDKRDASDGYIEGASFIVGGETAAVEETTDANGVIMIENAPYYTRDDEFEIEPWMYYSGYVANGGGTYDANGWTGGTGIAGRQYDIEKERANFLAAFKKKDNGKKDVVESSQTHENHYSGQTEKNLKVNPVWRNILIIETGVPEEYHTSPLRLIPLLFLTDDQGCVYAAIGGDTFGKGYVYKVEIIEKYNGNKIEDTIVLTILNSPVYTLNMNKFAKNEGAAGCNLAVQLSGAKFEAVRLIAKEGKNNALKSIATGTASININDLRSYNQMVLSLFGSSIALENTEEWIVNNGGRTATLKLWHENYRREEEVIIYQIKETTPPEGYQPKNFYLLLNTKNGVINTYIGYEEGGTITFNRNSIENTVDVKSINGKTVDLNVGNKPIKYDLNIHKVDIYANYDIPGTEFSIENITEDGYIAKITDAQGRIILEDLNALDIEGSRKKIIKLFENSAPQDYKLPDSYGSNIEIQIKFKFNGRTYDHYKDIDWTESADSEWCTDDVNYKKVTVIAELLTDVRDDYYDYELNNADYNTDGNKKVELTVKNTPIVSLNLNKIAANGNRLQETHFKITEYTREYNGTVDVSRIPNRDWTNLKIFNSGNLNYIENKNDFVVGNTGTTNIRFLADKKTMLIKIQEISTDEHYSTLYAPMYLSIQDGYIVGFYKENKRDRARLSNEKAAEMNGISYTEELGAFNIWNGTATRHQVAVDINNLTEIWLDLTKIYTGWTNGAIEGNAKFTVTSDKLETIQDTVTISAAEVREQVNGKYFKFRFKDNFERDANGDDTNKTLKVTFTVKEESSVYNRGANQFWAEIPEFKFTATFQKDNKGYIWLTDIGKPEAVNSTYTKTINDLYENKYKNNANDRYIDITNKGDRNATIDFKLRNPQVKNFDFILSKYDQDMHPASGHPTNIEAMNGITFKVIAQTPKASHTYTAEEGTTRSMQIGGTTYHGVLKVSLDISKSDFRKNSSNQSNNCLLDTTEEIKFYITEVANEKNQYYKFRKKQMTVVAQVTIDADGYYRLDEVYYASGHVNNSGRTKTVIELQAEDPTNDITGLNRPTICTLSHRNAIAIDVPNKRRWVKLQGTVWKDIDSYGKVSSVDGILNNKEYKDTNGNVIDKEKGIEGITVRLHKVDGNKIFNKYAFRIIQYSDNDILNFMDAGGNKILDQNTQISTLAALRTIINQNEVSYLETLTDDNGNYEFSVPMYNGYYYVEFIYNGYKYQHTLYTPWNGNGVRSNATETKTDREALNAKFATITPSMTIDGVSGETISKLNLINTETTEKTTNYKGIDIGISAYTGGFGKQNNDYVKYSATKATDSNEGKVYNSKENTSVPNNTANRNVLDTRHTSVRYDYLYKNVNLGITPREAVRLKLTKGVSNVTLSSGKNDGAAQQYEGTTYGIYNEGNGTITIENNIQLAPNISNVQTLNGSNFYNADNNSQAKYKQYKNAIGSYDLGVRVEDEYAYVDGNTAKANIKYAISLTNNSSEIGIKVNELVDYFDETFDYDRNKITVTDANGNAIKYELRNENKQLEIYNTSGNDTRSSKKFHEMHIILENPIELDPFITKIVYVTFTMDIKDNVVINDANGVENNTNDVKINNINTIPANKIKTNVAEVWSYSTYYVENGINANNTRYSYNEHNIGDIAGRVDMQSNPGNVSGIKETGIATEPYVPYINEYDDGIAFVRLVELRRRVFSGNVWVENRNITNATTKNAVIGNGIRESGETGLAGVKVQLREYLHNSNGTTTDRIARVFIDERAYAAKNANGEIQNTAIATNYYDTNNSNSHVKWMDAPTIVTTANNFTYSFTGVTTGDYYLLFTYPDGQTYKTTIYNGKINNGFNVNNPDNNTSVICNLDNSKKISDARDIYTASHYTTSSSATTNTRTRTYVNNLLSDGEINNNSTANKQIKADYNTYIAENRNNAIAMDAITGKIQVNFETDSSQANNLGQPQRVEDSIDWEYTRKFEKENIDLGLVERPKSQLKITNDIINVKLELANGSVLFDASQRATNVMWTGATDNNNWYYNGKMIKNPNYQLSGAAAETYNRYENRRRASVLATMDQELMQGSTVKIRYKITVTNVGEVDYSDKKFYYRGEEDNPGANVVKTAPLQIVDYVGYQGTNDDKGTRNNLNFAEAYNKDESGNLIWDYKTADELKNERLLATNIANTAKTNYNTIVVHNTNNSLNIDSSNGLAPFIKPTGCSAIPSEYATEIVLSRVISSSSGTDDLSYNNLVEIINLKNEVGRRTAYSTVGNQNPIKPAAELDADDSGMVIFTIPFGEKQEKYLSSEIIENNDYTIDIVLATAIIVLSALAVTIINKRK